MKDTELPDALPGIDIKEGIARIGGDPELYTRLLGKLHTKYASAPAEIMELLNTGEREEATRLAHTIKGSAGSLGAYELHDCAEALETVLKDGEQDIPQQRVEGLQSKLAQFGDAISPYISEEAPPSFETQGSSQEDVEAFRSSLIELLQALKTHKPKSIKAAWASVCSAPIPKTSGEAFTTIDGLIAKYKFKEAAAQINDFIDTLEG